MVKTSQWCITLPEPIIGKVFELELAQPVEYDGTEQTVNLKLDLSLLLQNLTLADLGYFSHSGDTALLPIVRNYEKAFTSY